MSKVKVLHAATVWADGTNHIQQIEKRRINRATRETLKNDTLESGNETKLVRTLPNGEEQIVSMLNYFPNEIDAQNWIDTNLKTICKKEIQA